MLCFTLLSRFEPMIIYTEGRHGEAKNKNIYCGKQTNLDVSYAKPFILRKRLFARTTHQFSKFCPQPDIDTERISISQFALMFL